MAQKKGILRAWQRFLQTNFNTFLPGATNIHKVRKYEHIEIQKKFQEVENARRLQRLSLIEYKKKLQKRLLEQKLDFAKSEQFIEHLNPQDEQLIEEIKKTKQNQDLEQFQSYQQFIQQSVQQKQTLNEGNSADKEFNEIAGEIFPQKGDMEKVIQLESELKKINSDLDSIKSTKNEIEKMELKIEELEPGHTILTGLQKKIVMTHLTYLDFMSRNLSGMVIHPETQKAIETVHHHVEHNIPIRRELLYEVMPELFETEMEQLDKIEREKILKKKPSLQTSHTSVIRVVEKEYGVPKKKLEYYEELQKQEFDMREMIYRHAIEIAYKWTDHFDIKLTQGFSSVDNILENLLYKPVEKKSEEEKAVWEDIQSLSKMKDDFEELVRLNKIRGFEKQRELYIPEFVKNNKRLLEAWTEKWELIVGQSFDIEDSYFLPNNDPGESQLDQVLKEQRNFDIDQLIKQSQLEYQDKIGGDEPVRGKDRDSKDLNLINKLNIISDAMNKIDDKKRQRVPLPETQYGQISSQDMPEEQRITVVELPKILFLNNKDPKKYDIQFWATHFNIEPLKLRNIFNYVSYAIPDVTNEQETGRIFRFIYE